MNTHLNRNRARYAAPLFAAALAALCGCERVSDNSIEQVQLADVAKASKERSQSYLIVDARDAKSFNQGHIPGATRLSAADIDFNDPDPKFKNYKAIYVYGEHPNHNNAKALVKRLLTSKIDDVYLMDDGFLAWRTNGYPIDTVTPTPAPTPAPAPKP